MWTQASGKGNLHWNSRIEFHLTLSKSRNLEASNQKLQITSDRTWDEHVDAYNAYSVRSSSSILIIPTTCWLGNTNMRTTVAVCGSAEENKTASKDNMLSQK